jgi:hypothetical protein
MKRTTSDILGNKIFAIETYLWAISTNLKRTDIGRFERIEASVNGITECLENLKLLKQSLEAEEKAK